MTAERHSAELIAITSSTIPRCLERSVPGNAEDPYGENRVPVACHILCLTVC